MKKHRTAAVLAREIPTATPDIDTDGIPWCNRKCQHHRPHQTLTPANCTLSESLVTKICEPAVKAMASKLPTPPRHTCSRCDKDAFNERNPGLPPEGITIKLFDNDEAVRRDGLEGDSKEWPMLCTRCADAIRALMVRHPDGIPF